ncbi:YfcE family phosphodiesterase [Kiritimatiellaeota bacterium B1221]|nr:YfcE family phosphodiesterase [Kiritimatiellaeota bacterium B1221]
MILGLLSDTHGHLHRTEAALCILKDAGSEHLIHCGDLGSEDILTLLFEQKEQGIPVTAVPGNVDEWDPDLILYAKKLGIPLPRLQRLELAGLNIAVHHGHDFHIMGNLLADPELQLLFTGHTHVAKDEQEGDIRIINPGAVYRANPPGVSVFNTETAELKFLPLNL